MRKIVESTFVTLDGVMSDPQNWGPAYWDDEHAAYAHDLLFSSDALLLGRKTYDAFAQAWPTRSGDEYTDRINALPKYVASRTLTETTWNASLLGDDLVAEVSRLKEQPGQNLLKFGTGELSQTLFRNNLTDEYHFWLFPVIAGSGQRLFEGLEMAHLELVNSTRFKSGIVVLKYAPK
ncbi:MAG TPA: dihydrofolate reductase family protein [Actinomycetota bacterium]|nr:dihydrofolate reductase family protein [Actinomycetota bacterium]